MLQILNAKQSQICLRVGIGNTIAIWNSKVYSTTYTYMKADLEFVNAVKSVTTAVK